MTLVQCNIIIYRGDVFGMRMRREFAELYAIDKLKPETLSPYAQGLSLWETFAERQWLATTAISFFCVTGFLDVHASAWVYLAYSLVTIAGIIGCLAPRRDDHHGPARQTLPVEIKAGLVCSCTITVALAMWYSYTTDFQPQGRYVFGCMAAIALIVSCGCDAITGWLQREKGSSSHGWQPDACMMAILVWVALLATCYFECLVPCFFPRV